uniref:Uncharacterized protein n=1 Tax=Arundo donax TaxID=35708 RepID=A0A0A9SF19_ARUDO
MGTFITYFVTFDMNTTSKIIYHIKTRSYLSYCQVVLPSAPTSQIVVPMLQFTLYLLVIAFSQWKP